MNYKKMVLLMGLSMAAMNSHYYKKDELENIDIEKEYHLIKQKKSRLSRRLRDLIVHKYENSVKPELKKLEN